MNAILIGWLVDETFRPSFSDLESTISRFVTNPIQYVFTVVSVYIISNFSYMHKMYIHAAQQFMSHVK